MGWPFLRDILLFLGGLGGVFHETILAKSDRPTLLILFAAMMGLPAFLQGGASEGVAERVMRPKASAKAEAAAAEDAKEKAAIAAEVQRILAEQHKPK